jgi:hydroxymethylpyrimidine pyrophosphatase-like HAD family hydrolase
MSTEFTKNSTTRTRRPPRRLLIVCDIDETVITRNHRMPGKRRFVDALGRLASVGGMFAFSSDATGKMVSHWEGRLKLREVPAVLERGAFIRTADGASWHDRETARSFAGVKNAIRNYLRGEGMVVQHTSPIPLLLGQRIALPPDLHRPNGVVAMTDRKTGVSMFAGEVDANGRVRRSAAVMERVHELVGAAGLYPNPRDRILAPNGLRWDINPDYAHIMVGQDGHTKEAGMEMLCDHLGLRVREKGGRGDHAWAIGDTLNDLSGANIMHGAVGNAHDAFKASADFVATDDHAAGAAQAIHHAIDHYLAV